MVYQIYETVLILCSLGIVLFSSDFLLNLLDTIVLPAKYTLHHLLHNRPSSDQQFTFQVDHECFYFLSADPHHYIDIQFDHGYTGGWLEIA